MHALDGSVDQTQCSSFDVGAATALTRGGPRNVAVNYRHGSGEDVENPAIRPGHGVDNRTG
eukprot:6275323-Prymnesium_polylepis.3